MRDAVELEWAGIPTVCIVHREMRDSAAAIARISGHADYPMIIVDYPYIPTATWSEDEIASLAREVAPQVLAALLGSSRPGGGATP
ncbi:MAG: hypothetical protein ACKOA9_01350 [Actinomycetota bacterium]